MGERVKNGESLDDTFLKRFSIKLTSIIIVNVELFAGVLYSTATFLAKILNKMAS